MSVSKIACRLAACAAVSAATVGLASGVARAADLPSRVVAPVAPVVVPVASWTGFYIGASAGADFPSSAFNTNRVATGFDLNAGTSNVSLSDVRARLGGYVGYNYQFNQFVVGVEGDGAYDFGKTKTSYGLPGQTYVVGGNTGDLFSGKSRFDASARGRAGFLMFPTALFYVTGGVAFRDQSVTASCSGGANSFCSRPEYQTFSSTRTGWTVGGGVEGMITPNLIARVEYRYSDFGSRDLNFFGAPNGSSGDYFGGRLHLNSSTVTAGLAYKFDFLRPAAPVVARY